MIKKDVHFIQGRSALFALLLAGCLSSAAATPKAVAAAPAITDASVSDFSAVESVKKSGALIGKPVDTLRLIVSKNVKAHGDTTMADLHALAVEQGLTGEVYTDLTMAQLRHATFPAILRVRCSRYSTTPDHFIVCQGIQNGDALIFNPPNTVRSVALECLATRWKGEALIVSTDNSKVDLSVWRYEAYFPTGALILAALLGIIGIRLWRRSTAKSSPPRMRMASLRVLPLVGQAAGLVVVAALLGFGTRVAFGKGLVIQAAMPASPEGPDPMDFLLKSDDSGAIAQPVKEISREDALARHTAGELFVDARDPGEFNANHIKGSMLCPASDVGHLRLNMAGIPKDRDIVVYCVDANCGKGHYIATALTQLGYARAVLYRDGWVKWTGPKESN